jgi:hypothetical protein
MNYENFTIGTEEKARGLSSEVLKEEIDLCRSMYSEPPTFGELFEELFDNFFRKGSFRKMNQITLSEYQFELARRN